MVREAAALAPGRALDLGAGEGSNALWLAARGWHITAVDFSAVALARLERLAESRGLRIETRLADATQALSLGSFDLALICYVHVPAVDRQSLLTAAAAQLAPGGHLLYVGARGFVAAAGVDPQNFPFERFPCADEVAREIVPSTRPEGALAVELAQDVPMQTIPSPEGPFEAARTLVRARAEQDR